eukprot:5306429-Amphidinium_carterae.1
MQSWSPGTSTVVTRSCSWSCEAPLNSCAGDELLSRAQSCLLVCRPCDKVLQHINCPGIPFVVGAKRLV